MEEVRAILPENFEILSLKDIGCNEELPENQRTLEGNAFEKAAWVFQHYNVDCFADDTGLEVEALNGEPGVDTAHYAGADRDALKNMNLLLKNLEGKSSRKARFRSVFCLFWQGEAYSFEGIVDGRISEKMTGNEGFGYDPIFIPNGFDKTFAELTLEEKGKISHRALAVEKFIKHLNQEN